MGILWDILSAPVLAAPKFVQFIAEKIDEVVQQEFVKTEDKLKGELLEWQMKLELGSISEEDYEKKEKEILKEMQKINAS
ncbi:MAG: gas vesicle protein GvpG [Chlamydiota bacterium]